MGQRAALVLAAIAQVAALVSCAWFAAERGATSLYVAAALLAVAAALAFLALRSLRRRLARASTAAEHVAADVARLAADASAAARTIGADASRLAAGSRDLSERTESQAGALQQAAAGMEQLTGGVHRNTDAARETQRIAALARDSTDRGIQAATLVIARMESVRDATKRMADIVGVIDAIAFQTNLLALNAAVEAARAGEQGRGFAVVASEVRALATRCADSARDIRALAATAAGEVAESAAAIDGMAETIAEVNGHVARVTELMNGVVAAGAEQSTGIAEVGRMIAQMEGAIHRNAALVGEVLAASRSLEGETARLDALAQDLRSEGAPVALAAQPGERGGEDHEENRSLPGPRELRAGHRRIGGPGADVRRLGS